MRISTVGFIFVIAMVIAGALFVASSLITIDNISTINTTWHKFEESRSEKAAALSALRKEIGYGGMIHQFKNFVLRHDKDRISIVNAKLGGAASAVARYRALDLSEGERNAIDDIQRTMNYYSDALMLTIDLIAKGKTPTEIDSLVRISDAAAIRGLDTLDNEVTKTSGGISSVSSKSQAVASLRRAMGYGGMIHNFKNMVLRHNHTALELTYRNIASAFKAIDLYSERSLNDVEHQAIRDIAGVIESYKSALTKAEEFSKQGKKPIDIDRAVQIDDGPALRGFDALTREIARQNGKEAERVSEALVFVASISEISAFVTLAIITLMVIASLWLVRTQITRPIERMTGVMARLAAGDLKLKVHATGQNNEIGEMARAVEIFRNTAIEREKAEEEIVQFKTTLDRTQDCIFMFKPDTLKFYYVNQGAMDQVGYSQQELFEMTLIDLNPEYNESSFRSFTQTLIEGRQKSATFETVHQHRNSALIPVEISLQYIAPANEESRFVAIVRDITERKKIDKAKSEFVSTVSHELRTPLTSIKGSLGLIKSGAVGELPGKFKSMLDIAYNNSDRLVLLINDILDMEKINAGKMEFNIGPMDIVSLVNEAIDANKGYGDEHNVTFFRSGNSEQILVDGDKDRLMQVFSNLMSNAAKFSPGGSEVELSVLHNGSFVRVSVRDSGPGIPKEFREKIFQKFSQADSSDTRMKGGTGLGLSITKAIVERHRGSIDFETESGNGSTFFFDLPILIKQGAGPDSETGDTGNTGNTGNDAQRDTLPNKEKVASGEKPRILHVEDDESILHVVSVLVDRSADVISAKTIKEAKNLINSEVFDLAILDLILPDGDGETLIPLLNKQGQPHVPVIVFSVKDTSNEIADGIYSALTKSHTNNDELLGAIHSALDIQQIAG